MRTQTSDIPEPNAPKDAPEPPKGEMFEFAQELPKYKDGDLQEFFKKNMKYPDFAREARVQGTVYVQCVVDLEGSIDTASIVIAKGLPKGGYGLDEEALRLVKLIPPKSFSPASNNGIPVKLMLRLRVKFSLEE